MTRLDPRDEAEIRATLDASAGDVLASDLRAHLAREAVFVVAPSLSLVECGVAIALDRSEAVAGWVRSGELRRPSADECAAWLADQARRWRAIVVQPYVLVQDPPE